jgi:hypothetical protein
MALYRDINVRISPDSYVFASPSSPDAPALVVDRPTGDVRLEPATQVAGRRVSRVTSIAGILGIVQLRLDKYVIIITKSQAVGRLRGQTVYRVVSTELLPLRERAIRDPDEDEFVSMLRTFLTGPMYFSYAVDLTNSLQRQTHADSSPLWMRADDRFFWNRFVQSDLVELRTRGSRASPGPQPDVDPYILPVIFGMLEIRPTTFRGTPLTIALISRRSRHRGGTRYFTRGLDSEGHAANYNETEQVVVLNDAGLGGHGGEARVVKAEAQYFSYVQTRGSVPTFWAEINSLKYTPRIQIRPIDAALGAARRHFDEQIRLYGDNYLVNLVNQKGREARVKDSYEAMVEKLVSSPHEETEADAPVTDEKFTIITPEHPHQKYDRLHYVYFDYHHETKGLRMDRAHLLVDKLGSALEAQGYFSAVEMPGRSDRLEPRSFQTSVVRTNCMDCLDRTNVVQSMLARHMLDRMFAECGLMSPGSTFKVEDPAFEYLFRNLWADNADAVSGSYAGTGAMKTDVTRMGMRTKAGMLQDARIGVTRYFKNNFLDGPRQDSFDLFLGVYRPDASLSGGLVFADRRPVLIQAVPYFLVFSLIMVLVGSLTRPSTLAVNVFVLFWAAIAIWCAGFVWRHGMLYVNWPRLAPRAFAQEGYEEHYAKASNSLLGPLVAGHARGLSTARYTGAEEGKKRIE